MTSQITKQIAQELSVKPEQVEAAVALLDQGSTVPFIARYRKEATGGLDDAQLRDLETRLSYLRELSDRKEAVLKSIESQGKLTAELQTLIQNASTKVILEDLYLPFKPKRRTKGQIAKEAGLEPLAELLFSDPAQDPLMLAAQYIRPIGDPLAVEGADFTTTQKVLDGARDILSERFAEDPALVQSLREWLWENAVLKSTQVTTKEPIAEAQKFSDYFDYSEPLVRIPSHRILAALRGRTLGVLSLQIELPAPVSSDPVSPSASMTPTEMLAEGRIAQHLGWSHKGRAADDFIRKCVSWTWRVKLSLSIERDLLTRIREQAEEVAIKVFADNLRDLLLAAPAGKRVVMGLDPGIRTGVKVAVVDETGKLVDTSTVYPHEPRRDWKGSLETLYKLCARHNVNLIAIGNGTASRETDQLAAELIEILSKDGANAVGSEASAAIQKVVVSEAGASVYSASEYASKEMPGVDVSLRGAASIARRLQDPLAELVKITPKSIGVGQYQHDVNPAQLDKALDAVVEDCVNAVGVDLNTASTPLLARVSGLSNTTAQSIVRWREKNGAFKNRKQLLDVTGLGAKTFEQSAGFLRIRGGDNPLDMTGVHPESYPLVEQVILKAACPVDELMGQPEKIRALKPEFFAKDGVGIITVKDIFQELEKKGRDPRPSFKVAKLNAEVKDIKDLKEGMLLQGTVSNVAAFGAFVDLGVHQDGLIHVSQLSHKFISDAREVVKTGDIVDVRVVSVDVPRSRIALTMKLDAGPGMNPSADGGNHFQKSNKAAHNSPHARGKAADTQSTVMSAAFAKLQALKK
jgi:uncharacterized protein